MSEKSKEGKFFLVTGSGHCGTRWIARVLNQPRRGIACLHEYKTEATGMDWKTSLQYELEKGLDQRFDPYWEFLNRKRDQYGALGDSNSWQMYLVPEVCSRIDTSRIFILVRNGIQNVHSLYYCTPLPRDDWLYTHFFRNYWNLLDKPCYEWQEYTDWACWCLYWKANYHMIKWLSDKVGEERVSVVRFEDLLTDGDQVYKLLHTIHPHLTIRSKIVKKMQKKDVNRKVKGDRTPESLWATWTDEQREKFTKLCSTEMEYFGYKIPPRP